MALPVPAGRISACLEPTLPSSHHYGGQGDGTWRRQHGRRRASAGRGRAGLTARQAAAICCSTASHAPNASLAQRFTAACTSYIPATSANPYEHLRWRAGRARHGAPAGPSALPCLHTQVKGGASSHCTASPLATSATCLFWLRHRVALLPFSGDAAAQNGGVPRSGGHPAHSAAARFTAGCLLPLRTCGGRCCCAHLGICGGRLRDASAAGPGERRRCRCRAPHAAPRLCAQ